jgi:hypothetical protein
LFSLVPLEKGAPIAKPSGCQLRSRGPPLLSRGIRGAGSACS